jgi:hypothetical protein
MDAKSGYLAQFDHSQFQIKASYPVARSSRYLEEADNALRQVLGVMYIDLGPSEQIAKEAIMSRKLMIVLTAIGVVGSSVASGASATPYNGAARANASKHHGGPYVRQYHLRFRRDSCGHIVAVYNSSQYF